MAIARLSSSSSASPTIALKRGSAKDPPNAGDSASRRARPLVVLTRSWDPLRVLEVPLVISASWSTPSVHSRSPGCRCRGSAGRGNDVTYFGAKSFIDLRRYLQHRNRIAPSTSVLPSSSPLGSSGIGVDSAALDEVEEPGIEEDRNDSWLNSGERNSSRLSDIASGSWESEDEEEKRVGDGGNGRNALESSSTYMDRENGSVDGNADVDSFFSEPSDVESVTSRQSSSLATSMSSSGAIPSAGSPKEPIYEVIHVNQRGAASKKHVSRRQLLRTSGLRLRDLRRIDPSLWVTNSAPALLIRDHAILLNLGSLRAVATTAEVLIFDRKSIGAQGFIRTLIPRLKENQQQPNFMPFEHEVIESALITRTERVERSLRDVEPRVLSLLDVLPTCMTADVLEELRLCKQELVEVGSKAGALRQMLLELLEHPQDIRRIVIMGRVCNFNHSDGSVDCVIPQDKLDSEDEEEEMEMLLEYYLQRCESVHGQSLKLLSSAKEMEESIGVNLSSRRLEVNKFELLLQVGTFCAALGALVAGIFGMNLKSYLEERATAFYVTTGGIVMGGVVLFFCMLNYLSKRKVL